MSDRDEAQITALEQIYPQSRIYLCKWHVLRAMRRHFVTSEFPELWENVKTLVNTDDLVIFWEIWDRILKEDNYPKTFKDYLLKNWMKEPQKWSKTARKNRTIFEEGDTNMLIES